MKRHVDLNADMGESFGPWRMGDDASLLRIVTSANVACGFHAGDPDVMAETMRHAVDNDVAIGAHPGFADLQGFGRRRMELPKESLRNLLRYQIGAAQGMAAAVGGRIGHVKLHGALANMAADDIDLARTCYETVMEIDPSLTVYVLCGTRQEEAARTTGVNWAGEIFADRAYNEDATLVDRRLEGAVIHDPVTAAARMVEMVREGAIIARDGTRLPAQIDTICLHGDGPEAIGIAQAVRAALTEAGIAVRGPA